MVQEILPFRVPEVVQAAFITEAFMEKIKKKTIYRTVRIIKEASKRELQCLIRKRAKKNK